MLFFTVLKEVVGELRPMLESYDRKCEVAIND